MSYVAYVRQVLTAADARVHKKARPVLRSQVRLPMFQGMVWDMIETMRHLNALGLAAPQIGWNYAVFVMAAHGLCAINPRIELYGIPVESIEGCLSLPGEPDRVLSRSPGLFLKARDLGWREYTMELKGPLAAVVQHEYDHLQGITIDEVARDAMSSAQMPVGE